MNPAPQKDTRRMTTRVERVNLVQVSRFDEDGFRADLTAGRTLNVSRGGLRLELHHALPLRSRIRLDLAVGEQLVTVDGVVVYLEALPDDRCAMGIAFQHLSPETERLLDTLVEEPPALLAQAEDPLE